MDISKVWHITNHQAILWTPSIIYTHKSTLFTQARNPPSMPQSLQPSRWRCQSAPTADSKHSVAVSVTSPYSQPWLTAGCGQILSHTGPVIHALPDWRPPQPHTNANFKAGSVFSQHQHNQVGADSLALIGWEVPPSTLAISQNYFQMGRHCGGSFNVRPKHSNFISPLMGHLCGGFSPTQV